LSDTPAAQFTTLKKRDDFVRLAKDGRKWVSKSLILQALHSPDLDENQIRAGFTVTKKTEKSAVKRNRIKRRLRAAVQAILPFHAKLQYDYVLIGRKQETEVPFDALKKDLLWCLKRLDCIRDA